MQENTGQVQYLIESFFEKIFRLICPYDLVLRIFYFAWRETGIQKGFEWQFR